MSARVFSITLDTKGRVDIGRKLEYCLWSAFVFLRAGCDSATLKGSGITLDESDMLIIQVKIRITGSSLQDLNIGLHANPSTSSSVISMNSQSSAEQISSTYGVGPTDARKSPKPWCILAILLLKKVSKTVSHHFINLPTMESAAQLPSRSFSTVVNSIV